MKLKKEIFVPDLSKLNQREIVMFKDIDNDYLKFVNKLTFFYKQEYALMDDCSYWGFPNGKLVDEIFDNEFRIVALCSEYLDFAKQVDFNSIITTAKEKYTSDCERRDNQEN